MDELEKLIEEQRKDDGYKIFPEFSTVHLGHLDTSAEHLRHYLKPKAFKPKTELTSYDKRHGTHSGYTGSTVVRSCRCSRCTKAEKIYRKINRLKQAKQKEEFKRKVNKVVLMLEKQFPEVLTNEMSLGELERLL